MTQNNDSPVASCLNEGISIPAVKTKPGRLQAFGHKNGNFQIVVDDDLPQCLVDANAAVKDKKNDEAKEILNEQAIEEVQKIIEKDPSRTDIMVILGKLFADIELWQSAEEWYLKALEQEEHLLLYCELANVCEKLSRSTESIQYYEKAIELTPDDARLWVHLARNMILTGRSQKGVELIREAIKKNPALDNDFTKGTLLWNEHYLPDMDPKAISDECKKFASICLPISVAKKDHDNNPDPHRKLRIGYLSADFQTHSASRSFEPFLDGHDRDVVELYAYSNTQNPDEVTKRFEKKFDYFRDILGIKSKGASSLVEKDKIDILVEIGGYSKNNRLDVLAFKPAPIQVDYGAISTVGMEQIDYRFTDSILDTPRLREFYIEECIDLPGGLFCYRPPEISPLITPLPAKKNGFITFGSFNNNNKISPYIIKIWCEVLKANKNSRLIMKFILGKDEGVREFYFNQFEELGVDRKRIEIHGWMHHMNHLKLYGQLDFVLDTYPFNGCITTLEALWMGVPVISLVGQNTLLSRVGLSILSRIGMETFAASNSDEFVAKTNAFAGQLDDLEKIRFSLRNLMLDSSLCDFNGYVKSIEAAYRKMWHKWCRSQGVEKDIELSSNTEVIKIS